MSDNADYSIREVPRDESGKMELLARQPPLWEYLLLGNTLYTARAAHEARWRDYELGYALHIGPVVEPGQLKTTLNERLSHATAITSNLERILDLRAQERAFGKLGEPGDAVLIEHMAARLIDLYAMLLGWAEETRALRVPDWAERLKELLVQFVDQPLRRTHEFVDEYIARLEGAINSLASGGSGPIEIDIRLTFTLDDALVREYKKELKRIRRYAR
jgi:hypothetical protein